MQENIKQVIVKNTVRKEFKTAPIFQYDVGHILSFEGFNLPEAFEVHYAFSESGEAVTQVGNNNQVAVPDALVQDGRGLYAWLYISDEETGLTKFTIQIPVTRRAKPTDQTPSPVEQSEIQQAIAALNTGVAKAETAAENAEQSEENASRYAENAYNSSVAAANSAESASGDARTATEKAQEAVTAAQTATTKAAEAAESERVAKQKAQEASASAEGIAEAVAAAQNAAQTATSKASEVAQNATTAAQKAHEATSAATRASQSASAAETARTGAETAQSAAAGSATAAAGSASAAQTSAGNAASSATAAAGSAQAAAQKKEQMDVRADEIEDQLTSLMSDIQAKQDAPSVAGTEGQVLSLDGQGNPVWTTVQTESEINDSTVADDSTWSSEKITEELQDKADVIISSASGAIASFPDGAAAPVEKLVVNVEPVQDLHGYDHPWPAGGGKNIIAITEYGGLYNKTAGTNLKYLSSAVVTQNANAVTITSTGSWQGGLFATPMLPAGTYTVHIEVSDSYARMTTYTTDSDLIVITNEGNASSTIDGKIITITEPRRIAIALVNGDAKTITYTNLQVESGQSYTSWTPYENICPITGWTETKVSRTGANVWDEEWEVGALDSNGSPIVVSAIRSKNYVPVIGGATYFEYASNDTAMWMNISQYDDNKAFIKQGALYSKNAITLETNTAFLKFYMVSAYGTTYNHDISINYPATDTEYHAYQGNTYNITLPTEAGTVYGGTLDVTTGELVVDRAIVDLGTLGWRRNGANTYYFSEFKNVAKKPTADGAPVNVVFEKYASLPSVMGGIYANRPDAISYNRNGNLYTVASEVPSGQCVYELIAPITYTLTPTEIRTLLCMNNIWADAGDVTVQYRADTKLYIDNKLSELVAQIVNS